MNVKGLFKLFTVLSVLSFGAHAAADDLELLKPGQLKVATLGTFPPFTMRSPNGQLDGLEIRVMKEIAKRLNLEYTPMLVQWDSLLVALEANQFDVSTAAMDITPARQKQIIFSDGWIESGARILTPLDSPIKSAADLKGKRVGTQVSSTYAVLAEEHGAVVKSYKSESDTVQDLANHNVDAVITDSITGAYLIKHVGLPIAMTDDYVSHIQKGFAFKKGKPHLVAAVNKALAEMKADGTYAKLTTDLIGYDPMPKEPVRSLAQ
jgi:polar amino acid transport system substrate-binding protein